MISVEQILNATNGGLDIILSIYPQARDCVHQKKNTSPYATSARLQPPCDNSIQKNMARYGRSQTSAAKVVAKMP